MKTNAFIYTFIVILLSACSSLYIPEQIEKQVQLTGLNLKKYSDENFLITPYKYDGKYESIGIFTLKTVPAAYREDFLPANIDTSKFYKTNVFVQKTQTNYTWYVENLENDVAIDLIYEKLKKMGADALVDFKVIYEDAQQVNSPKITIFTVSGFAIKRKE